MSEKIALLLDGGFVRIKLERRLGRFPTVTDVDALCQQILGKPRLAGKALFRIYWYDSRPYTGTETNPVDGSTINLGTDARATHNIALVDSLELQPDLAVRRGSVSFDGWKLKETALDELAKKKRPILPNDISPDLTQKGVDLRVGLDIAWISTRRIVDILVLVTGDSDLVPAMKYARKEGLKVYLEALGHGIKRELRAHSDYVF